MSDVVLERSLLREWLVEDFGADSDTLMELCCDERSGRPLYFSHVRIAVEATGNPLDSATFNIIARSYIYLTASYYVADSVMDGHFCHSSKLTTCELIPYLQALGAAALTYCLKAAKTLAQATRIHELFLDTLAENRMALEAERESRLRQTVDWKTESSHLWGRSNSFLFLLDYVCVARSYAMPCYLRPWVQQLLVLIQRGDDVCDWRTDIDSKSWTPFLRQAMGGNCHHPLSVEVMEERLYLDGLIEIELEIIEQELEALALRFNEYEFGASLHELCKAHIGRVKAKHKVFQDIKASIDEERYESHPLSTENAGTVVELSPLH